MDIVVKGINEGLLLILPEGDWNEIRQNLTERIESRTGFFNGAQVFIDVAAKDMRVVEITDLRDLMDNCGIQLKGLLSTSEVTQKNAKTLGIGTSIPVKRAKKEKQAECLPMTENSAFLVCKNIRSGVRIEKEESVVIFGDVNPGAEIISDKNVIIWGRIKGKVSAGAKGDDRAFISALSLENSQISIAGIMDIFPKRTKNPNPDVPLVLSIRNGEIILENSKA